MTQEIALSILKTGGNVFLTGEPGAGKTYVINQYINWLEASGLNVAVTASTGIAATHIGGLTIHSWSGVGTRNTLTRGDLDQISSNERLVKRIKKTQVLVIDEISMLDGKLLDMVDVICRTIKESTEAFGGLQVILVGDFFQLPPIVRQGEVLRYAFESRAWEDSKPLISYLTEQFRQEDELLLGLLSSIRKGQIEEDHYSLLREQTDIQFTDIEPTRLYTHNTDVDNVNNQKLQELPGYKTSFKMTSKGNKVLQESLARNCLSPQNLELKLEAMVMCTKNNFEAGYVNGTLGRIVEFDNYEGYPVVETAEKKKITIEPVAWEIVEDGKVKASIEQIPLRLAWAITVHKSQGMSLDATEIDLSKSFVYGQGYVALSRVRSLAGLKVLGINANALHVDPKIIKQDERFKSESEVAEETFLNLDKEELKTMHEQFIKANNGRIPSTKDLAKKATQTERLKKESTYTETKNLLLENLTLEKIASTRKLTLSTVVNHLEKLAEEKELQASDLKTVINNLKDWSKTEEKLFLSFTKNGTEKLKPIYEDTDGKYDYHHIRLARILYKLSDDTPF